jgi:hypothetical protein
MDDYEDAKLFIHQMKKKGKKVKALAYTDKKDVNDYSKILSNTITSKEMKDWRGGEALMQTVNSLGNKTYDLIVNLTLKENLLLQYILVATDSPFKVGFYKSKLPIHDMVISFTSEPKINEPVTIKELSKQLIYYLSTISS